MTRIQLHALLCMIALSCGQSAYSAEDDTKKLERAKHLIDTGRPDAARSILREVLRGDPNSVEAHMQLGAALASASENDNYDDAIAEEKMAIQLDPKSSGARRILGMIYANIGKHDDAIALLQESCKLNPSSFSAHRDLGSAYSAAGKTDDALLMWKKAAEIQPDNVAIHSRLATTLSKQEKYPEAISEATQAVKLNPAKAETHLILANIKLQSGDAAGSVESFKSAIEANGFDSLGCKNPLTAASALSGLGWALIRTKGTTTSLTEAVAYQRKAIKADPHFLPAFIRMAELLENQNKLKDAETMYRRIFAPSQFNPAVGLPYAKFLASAKRPDDARSILKKVLEKSPKNTQASSALADLDKQP